VYLALIAAEALQYVALAAAYAPKTKLVKNSHK
jgi:hypothetical protein